MLRRRSLGAFRPCDRHRLGEEVGQRTDPHGHQPAHQEAVVGAGVVEGQEERITHRATRREDGEEDPLDAQRRTDRRVQVRRDVVRQKDGHNGQKEQEGTEHRVGNDSAIGKKRKIAPPDNQKPGKGFNFCK